MVPAFCSLKGINAAKAIPDPNNMVCSKRLQMSRSIGSYDFIIDSFRVEVVLILLYAFIMEMFIYGLCVGLVVAAVVAVVSVSRVSKAKAEGKAEAERYKRMLSDRMELEAEGLKKVKDENEELRKMNENLRVSLLALRDKPGRKEMQRLQILQKAADRLTLNSPGFGPVWQAALKESEEEFQKVYTGVIPFLQRHIPGRTDAEVIDVDQSEPKS